MIEFDGLCKRFQATTALDNVSFSVEAGTIHALVGENGAGKSTLMKILSGAHQPDEGAIRIDSKQVHFNTPGSALNAGIGIIHQELNLIPYLSVAENIMLGKEPVTRWGLVDNNASRTRTTELLRTLGLDLDPDRLVGTLRVGEQQLVEIAKALASNIQILILDEPTSALSEAETENLMSVMESLRADGVTLIYISHKLEEVFRMADNITVLRDGQCIGTWAKDDLTESDVIGHMVGRTLSDLFPKTRVEPGEVVLQVENLSTSIHEFDDRRAISDVSFTLRRGEILGLAGLMGSGRTEVLEAIYGVLPARQISGTVQHSGNVVTVNSPEGAIAKGIAMVPEDRKNQSLIHPMTVRENTTLSSLHKFLTFGMVNQREEREATSRQIDRLSIKTPGQSANIEALSGGNQQKVVLARCLLTQPDILLLDEPTRGIDVGAKSEIYGLMNEIVANGTGIIMASSELPELLAMCDRILVMHEGRISREINSEDATQTAVMEAATGQIDAITTPA